MTFAPMNPDPRIPRGGIVPAPLNLRESWKHLRAVMVCVDYADLLAITLPRNRHHFRDVLIVTTHKDIATRDLAVQHNCTLYCTESFYSDGAVFNKWRALEEALDKAEMYQDGKRITEGWRAHPGWICLMDADVIWPSKLPEFKVPFGSLCSPLRHMGPMPRKGYPYPANQRSLDATIREDIVPQESVWSAFPIHRNVNEWAGYSQIFHVWDPHLNQCGNCNCPKSHHIDYHGDPSYCHGVCDVLWDACDRFAWHDTRWIHAGGADSFFQEKWGRGQSPSKVRPPFNVLHLGEAGVNWFGRATQLTDGSFPAEAKERRNSAMKIWAERRKHPQDPFREEKIQ